MSKTMARRLKTFFFYFACLKPGHPWHWQNLQEFHKFREYPPMRRGWNSVLGHRTARERRTSQEYETAETASKQRIY